MFTDPQIGDLGGETLNFHESRPKLDDPNLVRAFRTGDGAALSVVLELCVPTLRRVLAGRFGLSGDDLEDVLQKVRIAVWQAASRFRGESLLETYVIQIACNKARDHLREQSRRPVESAAVEESHASPSGAGDPETVLDRLRVEQALAQLPRRQREVVHSCLMLGRSLKETAADMGIAIGSAASMKAEGLLKLRRELLDEGAGAAAGGG